MTVCIVCADRERCIEKQDAAICPRKQIAMFGYDKIRIVNLEGFVNIQQGWWRGRRGFHAECKTVRLIHIVVRILAEDDNLDRWQRSVSRPTVYAFFLENVSG